MNPMNRKIARPVHKPHVPISRECMSRADAPGRNPLLYSIRGSQRTPRTAQTPVTADTHPTQHQPTAYHSSKAPAGRFVHRFPPTIFPLPPKLHGLRSHPHGFRRDWRCMIHIRAFLSPPNRKAEDRIDLRLTGLFLPILYKKRGTLTIT